MRRVLYPVLALGMVAATASFAAPAKVCNIVTDQEGDYSGAYDILSADVASGPTEFAATIRVKNTATTTLENLLETQWTLRFKVGNINHTFSAERVYSFVEPKGYRETGGAVITADSITWRVPRKDVMPKAKSVATDFTASTTQHGSQRDMANSTAKYVDQTPSCLKAK